MAISVLGFRPFCRSVFRFLYKKKLRFLGFDDYSFLHFLSYFALGFQFSVFGKYKLGFSDLLFDAQFGVFPVSLWKICASTTSPTCPPSRILLALFGFDRNLFRFCRFELFYFYLYGFAVCCIIQLSPEGEVNSGGQEPMIYRDAKAQKFFFQLGTLSPHRINERLSFH